MSKGLEALERVKRFSVLLDSEKDIVKDLVEIIPNTLKIIEKELKRLEELDNGAYVSVHINRYNELCDKEKALEIIKKKRVDIKYLRYRTKFNVEKYNDNYIETLTQEECDFLKEVFNKWLHQKKHKH